MRVCARELAAVGIRLVVYLGGFALLAALSIRLFPVLPGFALAPLPRPQWVAVERPHEMFAVTFPGIPDPHPLYRVLRAPAGGGRKDIMTVEAQGRSALVEIYRPGRARAAEAGPEAEIAAQAAVLGTVEQAASAPAIESPFGPVVLFDFTVAQGNRRRGCLGFARVIDDPPLQIAGWFCNAGGGMVARTAVACGLDRLTLLSAGSDPKLAEFFAKAELRGSSCGHKPGRRIAGDPPDWIDARRATRLRGTSRR